MNCPSGHPMIALTAEAAFCQTCDRPYVVLPGAGPVWHNCPHFADVARRLASLLAKRPAPNQDLFDAV